jgi:hypothetical protein
MSMVRWFALVPIEVGVEPLKSNSKGYVKPIYDDDEGEKEEAEDHKSEEYWAEGSHR